MDMTLSRLRRYLAEPISIQSLVFVRVLFGAILVWDCYRYFRYDRIGRYYVDTDLTFPYFGLDFIQPLPEPFIYWAWGAVGLFAFMIMIGAFYRVATIGFLVTFGYFFLLDRTQYLNHNYMVLLYAALLAIAPANRAWSVDSWLRPDIRNQSIPRWPVFALKLQTEVILIFAGIVKITDDWLRGEPLRMWMHARVDDVLIAPIFQYDWVLMSASFGTVVLHCLGAPLLLWKRTRLPIFLIYCAFHVSNSVFFNIGIFPWLTIAVTTIFFAPDWPQRALRQALSAFETVPPLTQDWSVAAGQGARLSTPILGFLVVWFAVQLFLPVRQAFFPNMVGWTGDGHRFSWRMRIYDRDAEGYFHVVSADGTQEWFVDPAHYLSDRQARSVLTRTDLIHDFAQFLEARMVSEGHEDAAVFAHIEKSLNGRPEQPFVDSTFDLTSIEYKYFGPDHWVMPLQTRAAEDRIASWWPPLPLQKP